MRFLADAASWLIDLAIGPPEEVLLRLDVELRPGVKLRLGRERFLGVLGTVLLWPLVAAAPPKGLLLIAMPGPVWVTVGPFLKMEPASASDRGLL